MLQAEKLSVRFGGLAAVDNVSLAVPRGAIVALIGPNGAGKTTVFNLVSGFIRPDQGSVRLEGRDITGLSPHEVCRLGVARTFQIVQPFGAQTVHENIAVGSHLHHRSRGDALRAAEVVAERVGLRAQLDKLAANLTIAGRKRLELARALATEPRVLLLDEVAGGLTEHECASLVSLIKEVRAGGVSIIWIEHVVHALIAVVDRLAVLHAGAIIASGDPHTVIKSPQVAEIYLGIEADV
jgi:branched-chain amino acid transport system ATP-binding protein